jgi:LysM repeat protein
MTDRTGAYIVKEGDTLPSIAKKILDEVLPQPKPDAELTDAELRHRVKLSLFEETEIIKRNNLGAPKLDSDNIKFISDRLRVGQQLEIPDPKEINPTEADKFGMTELLTIQISPYGVVQNTEGYAQVVKRDHPDWSDEDVSTRAHEIKRSMGNRDVLHNGEVIEQQTPLRGDDRR